MDFVKTFLNIEYVYNMSCPLNIVQLANYMYFVNCLLFILWLLHEW